MCFVHLLGFDATPLYLLVFFLSKTVTSVCILSLKLIGCKLDIRSHPDFMVIVLIIIVIWLNFFAVGQMHNFAFKMK